MWWLIRPGWWRTLVAILLLAALWPTLVLALPLREAGVVTTLSGKASIARVSLPQSVPLHFKDTVYLGDKISTAEDSIVRVLLGGKALVTVRELSIFSITEEIGKSTVGLTRGKISLAVARQRMAPGESVEVRTPNAVAAVRGTVLVVEVEPAQTAAATPGPAVIMSTITVIKGTVTAGSLNTPNSVTLNALQSVRVVGQTVGTVQNISPAMVTQLLKNLKPPQQFTESDEDTKKRVGKVEQAKALALAKVLMPEAFPEEEKAPEEKKKSNGDDEVLLEASAQARTKSGDEEGSPTTTTQAPVVSTTQQTEGLQEIFNLPPPPQLIIPPDQTINTNLTFSSALHTSGLLDGTGTVTVKGLYDWQGGIMAGAGTTEVQGGLALSGNVTLNRTLNLSGTSQIQGDFTVFGTGVLANTGTLTKASGTGTATINPVFNNTGTVAVNSGTLVLIGGGTNTGTFTGAGSAMLDFGGGTYNLNGGSLAGVGTIQVSGGTLAVNSSLTVDPAFNNASAVNVASGTLKLTGGGASTGSFAVASGATLEFDGGTYNLNSGSLAGAGTIQVSGGALAVNTSLTVAPAFNNAGAVNVNSGTLQLMGGGTHSGSFNVAGTLGFGGGTHAVSGVVSGTGALTVSGGVVTLSGTNTYSGATTISGGTLAVTVNDALGTSAGGTTVAAAGTLDLQNVTYSTTEPVTVNGGTLATSTGTSSFAGPVTLGATSTAAVTGTQLTLSGVIGDGGSGFGLTKTGAGTLVLSGANTYTGTTTVNGGTLSLAGGSAVADAGAVVLANAGVATLDLQASETIGSLAGGGTSGGNVTLNANTLTTGGNNGSTTYSGVLSGTGGLTKAGTGTLTLNGANTYDGATSVNAGTLLVTNATGLGSTTGVTTVGSGATLELNGTITAAENVTLNTGTLAGVSTPTLSGTLMLGAGTNTVTVAAGDTLTLSGVLSGTGDLNKTGSGTLAFDNTGLPYRLSGKTTVSGGTLSTTGNLVSIPAGETLTITDTMLHANGGVLDVDQSVIRVPFTANPVAIVQANGTNPLVLLTGGTHTLASTAGTTMFDLAGNPTNTTTEALDFDFVTNLTGLPPPDGNPDGVTATTGTDQPLRRPGSAGCVTANCLTKTLLEASGATLSGERFLKVDTALLEATVPILKLLASSTLTLNADAVNLAQMAKLVSGVGVALIELNASSLTVNVGSLINAAGGSYLNVMGDLVRLSNGASLTLNQGYVLRVAGGSVVDIFGALVDFGNSTSNKILSGNAVAPTLISGIPVALTGGASISQVQISGNPIQGGTLVDNVKNLLPPPLDQFTGSLIEINGTASRLRIKGN